MRHVFRAKRMGWDEEKDGIWFDSDSYTREEAEEEFVPYQGTTPDGHPYTGYEFNGIKYHEVTYPGEFEADDMPQDDTDVRDHQLKQME